MSDNESHQSESMAREIMNNASHTDEVLNDHRNQPASLPIRVVPPEDETAGRRGSAELEAPEGLSPRPGHLENAGSLIGTHGTYGAERAHGESQSGSREEFPPPTTGSRRTHMPSLRTEFYLRDDEDQVPIPHSSASGDGPAGISHIPIVRGPGGSLAAAARHGRSRDRSFSEQVKILQNPHHTHVVPAISTDPNSSAKSRMPPNVPLTQPPVSSERGILLNPSSGGGSASGAAANSSNKKPTKPKARRGSFLNDNLDSDIVSPLTKSKTNDSGLSEGGAYRRERRASRSSIDSDLDSRASRSSQETEEDVCFPMLREHVRINGIDFDEIEEFIKEEREEANYMKQQQNLIAERTAFRVSRNATSTGIRSDAEKGGIHSASSAALKYTPKNILKRTQTTLSKLAHSQDQGNDDNEGEQDVRVTVNAPEKLTSDSSSVNEDSLEEKAHISPSIGPASGGVGDDDYDSIASEAVKFGSTRINDASSSLPDRFSFFLSESDETVHSPDIPSLVEPGQTVRELFKNGESTWWLDCGCPTDEEMKMIAKAFGIHPLTAEDIRMQETREKVELFRNYYFVCFHTFEPDKESEDYLEPINVYIVVFREGILSFHFSPVQHPANVRRRVRQLRDYVDVSADWLCYALIDDITDGFAPVITGIEYEADAIEDSVFVAREMDFSNMLQRIGESRRKVMTLMRLLSGKADVIKMFAKRCQDEALHHHNQYQQLQQQQHQQPQHSGVSQSTTNLAGMDGQSFRNLHQFQFQGPQPLPQGVAGSYPIPPNHPITQPRADIALYLGDIQDHVVTMFQNLLAYEKIFSRSHSNYLAQLQVESFHSNNKVTEMLGKFTLLGTILIPLNVITGLFGMNVHVPGAGGTGLGWFFGIIGVMVFFVAVALVAANFWLNRLLGTPAPQPMSSRRSIKSLGLRRSAAKSILSFPNKYE